MVWISVLLQNSYIEILMSIVMVLGGGALEKRLGHESETLVNQVSVLLNETPQSLLVPSTVWKGRSGKIALYKKSSPNTKSSDAIILNFPAARTMRNKCYL